MQFIRWSAFFAMTTIELIIHLGGNDMRVLILILLVLVCLAIILVIGIMCYIYTLPKRQKNNEIVNGSIVLFEEQLEAERTKLNARILGKLTRDRIERIAKQ